MAARILLRIPKPSQPLVLALACQFATLAALVVVCLIIVWTAELFR